MDSACQGRKLIALVMTWFGWIGIGKAVLKTRWEVFYMKTVGAYQAKTHLPALLDEVAKGEKVMITRHGVPVAVLSAVPMMSGSADVTTVVDGFKRIREGMAKADAVQGRATAKGSTHAAGAGHAGVALSIKEMIEEGRRF